MLNENGVAGSVLIIDNVSFTGVSSQPALMNGDFELWETKAIYSVDEWYNQGESDGVIRTADAYKGEFAIELVTYLGTDQQNNPVARAGQIATGYYPRNCGDNCNQLGGYPFVNQVDTLAFWYKYTPATDDSAQVYLQFKKNSSPINGAFAKLPASIDYQYFELPFNVYMEPDTVIVNLQSTGWNDTLLSSAGSSLIIDEIHFKSQPILYANFPALTTKNQISVFPNPSAGKFRIRNDAGLTQVIVYNMLGKQVFSKNYLVRDKVIEIDLVKFQKGLYFMEIYNGSKIHTEKIVIQ
jgi:hypothetical protein